MRILVLNNTSDLYGGSKIMSIVVKILLEGNHQPVVVLSETGPLVAELESIGAEVRIIRLGILRRKYLSFQGILNRIKVTSQAWKALNNLVTEKKIDLVYSNTTGVFIGAFLARRRRLKHIWHVHEIITKPAAFTWIIGYLLKKYSDRIIVVSDAVKKHWERHTDKEKICRIYNGIDTAQIENAGNQLRLEFGIQEEQRIVTMIGRVNHWKGQDYFIDIARNMLKILPDIQFLMAGDAYPGNEHLVEHLNQRLINEGLSDNVHYIGYRTDIPELLATSDLFVLPSILPDPFPTVILEAMACGKPVAATMHGGALEMIADGETGILIPYSDAKSASQKIIQIISNKQNLERMGQLAKKRITTYFSLNAFKEAILRVFEETLSEKPNA